MKILAIGNSFSQDATAYLHQTAQAQGIELDVYNLYIGGCPLEKHCLNLETGEAAYDWQHNGESTGQMISLQDALHFQSWDAVITQQASHDSGWVESYEPFLGILTKYLRREVPGARLLLHETWAYEHTSAHRFFLRYNRSQEEMYGRVRDCYHSMAQKYGMELIPGGDLIQAVRALPAFHTPTGGQTLCMDDGFHMNLYGRYLLALCWIRTLCSAEVGGNPYVPEPGRGVENVDESLIALLRQAAQA